MNIKEYSIEELTMILEYLENTQLTDIGDMIDEVYTEINTKVNDEE